VKGNLQLDTEKRQATIKKIQDITEKLKIDPELGRTNVKAFLFAPRYFSTSLIPKEFRDSYKGINLFGVNEYLHELEVEYNFANEDEYKEKLNYLAHRMFECISFTEIDKLELQRTALGESFIKIPNAPKKNTIAISRTNNRLSQSLQSPSILTNTYPRASEYLQPMRLSFDTA